MWSGRSTSDFIDPTCTGSRMENRSRVSSPYGFAYSGPRRFLATRQRRPSSPSRIPVLSLELRNAEESRRILGTTASRAGFSLDSYSITVAVKTSRSSATMLCRWSVQIG